MCCRCGGGKALDPPSMLQEGMLCRSSDYRTVSGDPNFNVVKVQADVSQLAYHMLMMVEAVPKQSGDFNKVTNIYVLRGWECYVQNEYEIKDFNVLQVRSAEEWKTVYTST